MGLILWIIGGLVALCGGLTYAELGAMFPSSGTFLDLVTPRVILTHSHVVPRSGQGLLGEGLPNGQRHVLLFVRVVPCLPGPRGIHGCTDVSRACALHDLKLTQIGPP